MGKAIITNINQYNQCLTDISRYNQYFLKMIFQYWLNVSYYYKLSGKLMKESKKAANLLRVIVGGSNKMHWKEKYQDFLKWVGLFLGHSLKIIK